MVGNDYNDNCWIWGCLSNGKKDRKKERKIFYLNHLIEKKLFLDFCWQNTRILLCNNGIIRFVTLFKFTHANFGNKMIFEAKNLKLKFSALSLPLPAIVQNFQVAEVEVKGAIISVIIFFTKFCI